MMRVSCITLSLLACFSCSSIGSVSNLSLQAQETTNLCVDKVKELTGKELSSEVDHIYVHVFPKGYTLYFSNGAIGVFGKRSFIKTVWSCAVTHNKVVYLGAPLKDDLLNEGMDYDSFENYDTDVAELLFKREGSVFKYCCSQKYDEDNIEKNNPNFPWDMRVE